MKKHQSGHLLNSNMPTEINQGDKGLNDNTLLSRILVKLAIDGDISGWSPPYTHNDRRLGSRRIRIHRGKFLDYKSTIEKGYHKDSLTC